MPRVRTSLVRTAPCLSALLALLVALLAGAPSTSALDRSHAAARTGPDSLYASAGPLIRLTNDGKAKAATEYGTADVVRKLFAKRSANAVFAYPRCKDSGLVVKCTSAMKNKKSKKSMGTANVVVTGDGAGKTTYVSFS